VSSRFCLNIPSVIRWAVHGFFHLLGLFFVVEAVMPRLQSLDSPVVVESFRVAVLGLRVPQLCENVFELLQDCAV